MLTPSQKAKIARNSKPVFYCSKPRCDEPIQRFAGYWEYNINERVQRHVLHYNILGCDFHVKEWMKIKDMVGGSNAIILDFPCRVTVHTLEKAVKQILAQYLELSISQIYYLPKTDLKNSLRVCKKHL